MSARRRSPDRPIVIAHRGASGFRPEHTLASYQLAIDMGADYIELDLVCSSDGVLVVRHENELSDTTDVAAHPEFASRRSTKVVDGITVSGWFTEDFTLAELRTLRAKERLPALRPQNVTYDGRFAIPTLQEVIDLTRTNDASLDRVIGIYPETKHPTYFASLGLPIDETLVEVLHKSGYSGPEAAVFIQSFEVGNLRRLRQITELPLIQLIDAVGRPYDFVIAGDTRTYADLVTPAGLAEVARYADGIGVHKSWLIPGDWQGAPAPTTLVADAHAAGLLVHAWTFRVENWFLPEPLRRGDPRDADHRRHHGDLAKELHLHLALGLDGFFTDDPVIGVAARDGVTG